MRLNLAVPFALAALLSGCRFYYFQQHGIAPDEFSRDEYECATENNTGYEVRSSGSVHRGRGFIGAMGRSRGEATVNKRMFQMCMRSRGYQVIEVARFETPPPYAYESEIANE